MNWVGRFPPRPVCLTSCYRDIPHTVVNRQPVLNQDIPEWCPLPNQPEVSATMISEARAHIPFTITHSDVPQAKNEWYAEFLNKAIKHPGVPCTCCGMAPNGELYDHMTPEQLAAMQPKES